MVVGVTLNYHYCGGKLKSISLYTKKGCCGEKSGEMKGCCENKTITKKIEEKHKGTSALDVPKTSFQDLFIVPANNALLCFTVPPVNTNLSFNIHAPPDIKTVDTWLLTRTILI